MRACLFLIPLLVSSAGCREQPDEAAAPGTAVATPTEGKVGTGATASASARSDGQSVAVSETTDAYSFEYAYPGLARGIAPLERFLIDDRDRIRADLVRDAGQWMAEGHAGNVPLNPYSYATGWEVVADLPDYLSLSAGFSTYSGGAHGMIGMRSIVYDRAGQTVIEPSEFFTDGIEAALAPRLCPALDKERAKRRGEPVTKGDPDDFFSACPDLAETTLLLGSANGKTFDRLTVYFGPYVAGPYAEGDYEIDLDVDAAVLKAVKPRYAGAFTIRRR